MKKTKNLLLVFVFIVLGLVICEIITRIVSPVIFTAYKRRFQFQPKYGWTHRMNAIEYDARKGKKTVRFEFNSTGYRDINHSLNKPPRTKRVLVIGDSFSAATQVNLQDTYWYQLQELMNKQSVYRWEMLNFGVGSYGTTQEYLTLIDQGLKYQPDAIILQIFPLNDICDNTIEAAYTGGPQDYYRPYWDQSDEDQPITYLHPVLTKLRKYSYLVRIVEPTAIKLYRKVRKYPELGSDEDVQNRRLKIVERDSVYAGEDFSEIERGIVLLNTFAHPKEQLDIIRKGWDLTENLIQRIIDVGVSKNIPTIMVVIPHEIQLEPAYSFVENRYPFHIDSNYADQRLEELADRNNIPFVTLLREFADNLDQVLPYIDGHLNKKAHYIVARNLKLKLEKAFLEPPEMEQGE